MGIGEDDAAACQPIHVRRLNLRMAAQEADPIVQVVDHDQQHVRPNRLLGEAQAL